MRLCIALALTFCAACGPHPLDTAFKTSESLAQEILGAVARRDEARLRELAVSEREFEERVWPGLPAARPERNLPWSYVWMDLQQKSDGSLKRTLSEYGGHNYQLQQVRFEGKHTRHGNYEVFRESVLVVADESGKAHELRILGSMIAADGKWKVFSYVTD